MSSDLGADSSGQPSDSSVHSADQQAWKRLAGRLPSPTQQGERDDLLWQEFTAQFGWYDRAATRNRLAYQVLKMVALVAGAAVAVLAAMSAPAGVTAGLAAGVVVAEGAQQLFQLHPNWLSYRTTAESLRQQAFLYVAGIAPYDNVESRRERLAAAMRELTTKENANWTLSMTPTASPAGPTP